MTEVIAWMYDAAVHCDDCALERFGTDERGYVPREATDSEGNEVHSIPNWESAISEDHDFADGPAIEMCDTCGTIIESIAYEGALPYLHPIATVADIQEEWRQHEVDKRDEEIDWLKDELTYAKKYEQRLEDVSSLLRDVERGIADLSEVHDLIEREIY